MQIVVGMDFEIVIKRSDRRNFFLNGSSLQDAILLFVVDHVHQWSSKRYASSERKKVFSSTLAMCITLRNLCNDVTNAPMMIKIDETCTNKIITFLFAAIGNGSGNPTKLMTKKARIASNHQSVENHFHGHRRLGSFSATIHKSPTAVAAAKPKREKCSKSGWKKDGEQFFSALQKFVKIKETKNCLLKVIESTN